MATQISLLPGIFKRPLQTSPNSPENTQAAFKMWRNDKWTFWFRYYKSNQKVFVSMCTCVCLQVWRVPLLTLIRVFLIPFWPPPSLIHWSRKRRGNGYWFFRFIILSLDDFSLATGIAQTEYLACVDFFSASWLLLRYNKCLLALF